MYHKYVLSILEGILSLPGDPEALNKSILIKETTSADANSINAVCIPTASLRVSNKNGAKNAIRFELTKVIFLQVLQCNLHSFAKAGIHISVYDMICNH